PTLLARRLGSDDIDLLAPHFDARVRLHREIVVPVWVARRSSIRGEDHVARVVAEVSNRADAAHTRLRAGVVEQEQRRSLERAANASFIGAELVDHLGVELIGRRGHRTPLTLTTPHTTARGPETRRVSVDSAGGPLPGWCG